jgi:hypothetical protein
MALWINLSWCLLGNIRLVDWFSLLLPHLWCGLGGLGWGWRVMKLCFVANLPQLFQKISVVKQMKCTFYSIYYELTTSTCCEHCLLIFRRCCTNNTGYIVCVLCLLAATRVGVERSSTPTLVAANRPNTHTIYQVLFVQHLLKLSKQCSQHVEVVNS